MGQSEFGGPTGEHTSNAGNAGKRFAPHILVAKGIRRQCGLLLLKEKLKILNVLSSSRTLLAEFATVLQAE